MIDKIDDMFDSSDIELWRLGQKLCHKYRISYWIAFIDYGYNIKLKLIKFSINRMSLPYEKNGVIQKPLTPDNYIERTDIVKMFKIELHGREDRTNV